MSSCRTFVVCIALLSIAGPLNAAARAFISGVEPQPCVQPGARIEIAGRGFGRSGSYLLVAADRRRTYPLSVVRWTDTLIVANVPRSAPFEPGRSFSLGLRDSQGVWASNTDRNFLVCGSAASAGSEELRLPPGTTFPTPTTETSERTSDDGAPPDVNPDPQPAGRYEVLKESGGGAASAQMGRLEAPTDDEEGDFETGELVAAHGEMDGARAFDALAAEEGGRLLRRRTLKGLQMVVSTYRFESNAALRVAFRKLAPGFQGLALDRNSHFGSLGPSAADQRKRNAALKWSDSLASCSEKLRIGMLDTGILNTHTALLGRSIRQHSFLPAGAEPSDLDHGTAIATILLGGRGAEEFAGLLPEAELFAGAVFRRRGNKAVTTAEALALGLDWLVTERVSAVNLSLGGSFNKLVEAALQKVIGLDIAVVAAAGADDANDKPLYPAYMPGVVAVTAVDGNWESARDHPRGSYISFAAPGIDVWAGNAEGGGSYVSGSSYAAPFVTAAIAAAGSNGYATLSRGARDLGAPGRDPVYGWGLIQFAPGCSGGSER